MTSRFRFEWLEEPGLPTYVTLFDGRLYRHYVFGVGHGGDEPEALLNLWEILIDRDEPREAIDHVAAAFTKRTGMSPVRRPSQD